MKRIEDKTKVRDYITAHLFEFERGMPDELIHISDVPYTEITQVLQKYCALITIRSSFFSEEILAKLCDYSKIWGVSSWVLKDKNKFTQQLCY